MHEGIRRPPTTRGFPNESRAEPVALANAGRASLLQSGAFGPAWLRSPFGCITHMKRQLTAAFVCIHCRKVFKQPSHRLVGTHYEPLNRDRACPQCQTVLVRVGDAFRAPRKDDLAAWERVERDIAKGRTFVPDEGFGRTPRSVKRQQSPKGLHSLFQLPARKRRGRAESGRRDDCPRGSHAT